jgi:hypothetical protein
MRTSKGQAGSRRCTRCARREKGWADMAGSGLGGGKEPAIGD